MADPNYFSQVDSVLNDVQVMTGDVDLSFLDMNEPIKSWARYCRRDTLSKVAQIDMVGALMKLVWWCALPIAECDYPELILIVRRALLFVVGHPERIRPAVNNAKRQHLIVCGPLVSILHSPTLGAIDYARALSDTDPGCEITFLMCQYFLGADVQPYIDHVFANQKNKPTIKDLSNQLTASSIFESRDMLLFTYLVQMHLIPGSVSLPEYIRRSCSHAVTCHHSSTQMFTGINNPMTTSDRFGSDAVCQKCT